MILRLNAEVLEDGTLPETLHVVLRQSQPNPGQTPHIKPHIPNSQPVHAVWDNGSRNLQQSTVSTPSTVAPIKAK